MRNRQSHHWKVSEEYLHSSLFESGVPVVWFRERVFLVAQEPTVSVCCVQDVDVTPFERSTRRRQGSRWPGPFVSVPSCMCVVVVAGNGAESEQVESTDEPKEPHDGERESLSIIFRNETRR